MTIGPLRIWIERRSLVGWRILALAIALVTLGAQFALAQSAPLSLAQFPAWLSLLGMVLTGIGSGFAAYGAFRIRIQHLERDVRDLEEHKAEKLAVAANRDRILGLQDEGRRWWDGVRDELAYIRNRIDALTDQRGVSR